MGCRWLFLWLGVMTMTGANGALAQAPTLAASDFFESRIRPVLIQRCFECHGRDSAKGGLRVDSREALLKGGQSGAAVVAGKSVASVLVKAIRRSDVNLQMPPKTPLSQQVVADFERWINDGAVWPAFEPSRQRRVVSQEHVASKTPLDEPLKPALQLWLKADAQPWHDGQGVSVWEDASGRGHDLVATAGARPQGLGGPGKFVANSSISGFPAVRFDAHTGLGGNAATAPDISGDGEFTMVLVVRLAAEQPTAEGLLAGFGEPSHAGNPGMARCALIGVQSGGHGVPIVVGGWGNDARPLASLQQPLLNGPPTILTLTKTRGPLASGSRYYLNGQDAGPLTGNNAVPDFGRRRDLGFMMGRVQNWSRSFNGDVAEVVLFNRALAESERRGLEAYLSTKFRIPLVSSQRVEVVTGGDPAFQPTHWAFEPLRRVEPPVMKGVTHPVDQFVSQRWHSALNLDNATAHGTMKARTISAGSVPAAMEPRASILVRRLYFDLLGLPPTPEEMRVAVASLTPWDDVAWAALIDKLLSSPHYGERWGRHWLDVVRYADTAGDNADYPVPEMRLYRDYVIDSFNADKPYDQFIREQLAGDLLAATAPRERYAELVTATTFLGLSRRFATGPYEFWHLTLEDTIDTIGQSMMGITLRCARCHDHKFDPVSQFDYYALYGVFESTQFGWAGAEEFQSMNKPRQDFVPLLPPAEVAALRAAHAEQERLLPERLAQLERDEKDKSQLAAKMAALRAPFEIARKRGAPESVPLAYGVREGIARPTVFQRQGDPDQPGPIVARGMPTFLPQGPQIAVPENESGRRQLADWLTHPAHPLTARVMVNRVWQHHFGQGLVSTPSNFGTRGSQPTHPELLDWLARKFQSDGWSLKKLHRLLLTSRTWRLPSNYESPLSEIDPANDLLWRHDRRRLDAESIRDALLAVSGRLQRDRPGAHPFPPITHWNFSQHNQFRDFYPSTHRSVYLMTTRLQRHPFLALFDGPDTNTSTATRPQSIVPAQALYWLNSPEIKVAADAFAAKLLELPRRERLAMAYQFALQRHPTDVDVARSEEFLRTYESHSSEPAAWSALCRTLLTSNEFVLID